jgi:hypothetical protein
MRKMLIRWLGGRYYCAAFYGNMTRAVNLNGTANAYLVGPWTENHYVFIFG